MSWVEPLESRILMARVEGIDVSQFQGTFDWNQIRDAGKEFAFVRSSIGSSANSPNLDTQFHANMSGGAAAGMLMGVYHRAKPDASANDAVNEANWFLTNAQQYMTAGWLRPVVDIENTDVGGLNKAALSAWVNTFSDTVQAATGVTPMVYANTTTATDLLDTSVSADHDLWIARYNTGTINSQADQPQTSGSFPNPYGAWNVPLGGTASHDSWSFWQYTNQGTLAAITVNTVDFNVFQGDRAALESQFVISQPNAKFQLSVNFGPYETAAPSGYVNVADQAYTNISGYQMGWTGSTKPVAFRRTGGTAPDERYRTYVRPGYQSVNRSFEVAVPNGTYRVRVVAGSPDEVGSTTKFWAEGTSVINAVTTTPNPFLTGVATVTVSDGKLTISSDAATAPNSRLTFVDIVDASRITAPPLAPGGVSATPASSTTMDVRWTDNADNEGKDPSGFDNTTWGKVNEGYKVERRTFSGGAWSSWSLRGYARGNAELYQDTGLSASTQYQYRVSAVNNVGPSAAIESPAVTTVAADSQQTYSSTGSAWPIGTTIQAEDFDRGGQGVSFNDLSTTGNAGGFYREGGMDVGRIGAPNNGMALTPRVHRIDYFRPGEWVEYTINVPTAGVYAMDFRVSVPGTDAKFHATTIQGGNETNLAGQNSTDTWDVPNTGDWDTFTTVTKNVMLPAGQQIIRIYADSRTGSNPGVMDFDWMRVTTSAPTNLLAEGLSGSQIKLAWKDNSDNETGFAIERSLDGATWAEINTVAAGVTSYTDEGLTFDTRYYYRVRASLTTGGSTAYSDYTNVAIASTLNGDYFYRNDFESPDAAGDEWSRQGVSSTVKTSITPTGQRRFLGDFNNDTVSLELSQLPSHEAVSVSFDVYVIRSWDGSDTALYGPDHWSLGVRNGQTLVDTTFSNHEEIVTAGTQNDRQNWPGDAPSGANNPATSAATEVDTLGYTFYRYSIMQLEEMSSVYRITRTFAHDDPNLTLDFKAWGLQGLLDESWGIDNIIVSKSLLAPTLSASDDVANREIDLTWNYDGTGADQFIVERSVGGSEFATIATIDAASPHSFSDQNVSFGIEYTYRIKAVAAGGATESGYSNEVREQLASDYIPAIGGVPTTSVPEGTTINLTGSLPVTPPSGMPELFWTVTKNGNVYQEGRGNAFSFTTDDNGTYVVLLETSAIGGTRHSSTATILATNVAPTAAIDGPDDISSGSPMVLNALAADPGLADTFTYAWTVRLNGGVVATGNAAVLEYLPTADGAYAIELLITDDDGGGPARATKTVLVGDQILDVSIDGVVETMDEGGHLLLAGSTNSGAAGYFLSYDWTVTKNGEEYATWTGQSFDFNPTDNGEYRISLTAEDGYARGHADEIIIVNNVAPTAIVSAAATELIEGTTKVTVSGSLFDPGTLDRPLLVSNWTVLKDGLPLALPETADVPSIQFAFVSGSVYVVRLDVMDKDGASGYGELTLTTIPHAPQGVLAETVSTDTIVVRWADPSNIENGFRVISRRSGETTETMSGLIDPNVTHYVAENLVLGVKYDFKVVAYDVSGTIGQSTWISAATQPTPPAIIEAVALSNRKIRVRWDENSIDPVARDNVSTTRLQLERRSSADPEFVRVGNEIAPTLTGTRIVDYVDTNLEPGKLYYYRLRRYTLPGGPPVSSKQSFSEYSEIRSATTTAVLPNAPTNLTINVDDEIAGEARLQWDADVLNSDGYQIEVSSDDGATFTEVIDFASGHYGLGTTGNSVSASVGGLSSDLTYKFRVRAYAKFVDQTDENRSFTQFATSGSYQPIALPAVTGFAATQLNNRQVTLDWDDQQSDEASQYVVDVLRNGVYEPVSRTARTAGSTAKISNLEPGQVYTFRIRALRNTAPFVGGPGTYSVASETSGTTTAALPLAPTDPKFSRAGSQVGVVEIGWTDPVDPNRESFEVQIAPTAGGEYRTVGLRSSTSIYSSQRRYIIGLTPATEYNVRVRSVNSVGQSAWVSLPSVTTRAIQAPSSVTVATPTATGSNTNRQLAIHWTYPSAPSNATPSGYEIQVRDTSTNVIRNYPITGGPATASNPYIAKNLNAGHTYAVSVRAVFNQSAPNDYFNANITAATVMYSGLTAAAAPLATTAIAPAAPSAMTASGTGRDSITLQWLDNTYFEDEFKVEVSTNGTTFSPAAATVRLGVDAKKIKIEGLAAGTAYWARVRAVNEVGESAWAVTTAQTFSDPMVVPPAPTAVTLVVTSPGQIEASWASVPGAAGYHVYMSTKNGPFELVDTILAATPATGTVKLPINWLTPSTSYAIRIHAYNSVGISGPSNTAAEQTPPFAAPTDLIAQAKSHTQVLLSWKETNTNEAGFLIEQSEDGVNFTRVSKSVGSQAANPEAPANMRAYLVQGLRPGRAYYYRVSSLGNTNLFASKYTNIASATPTPMPAPTAPVLNAPEVLSDRSIRLTWDDTSDNETRFEILRWRGDEDITDIVLPSEAGDLKFDGIQYHASDVNDYIISGLAAATEYSFRVRATNAGGNSIVSDVVIAKTLPATPANVQVEPNSLSQNTITWTPTPGATSYVVESSNDGVTWIEAGTASTSASFIDSDVAQRLFYRVKAISVDAESSYSKPILPKLAAPTLTAGSQGTDTITLTYGHANPSALAGYRIEREEGTNNWLTIATPAATASGTFVDSGLEELRSYKYRITALTPIAFVPVAESSGVTHIRSSEMVDARIISGALAEVSWTNRSSKATYVRIKYTDGVTTNYVNNVSAQSGRATFSGQFKPSTDYEFTVQVTNGTSNESEALERESLAFPHQPESLATGTVTAAAGVPLTWDIDSGEVDGVVVERSDNGSNWSAIETLGFATSFTDTDVAEGDRYHYRIVTFNEHGSSFPSEAIVARVPLAAPSDLAVLESKSNQMELAWTNNSRRATELLVSLRPAGSDDWSNEFSVIGVPGANKSTINMSFEPSTTYEVKVKVVLGTDHQSPEATMEFVTPAFPQTPSALEAPSGDLTYAQAKLTWTGAVGTVSGYIVERAEGSGNYWTPVGLTDADDLDLIDASVDPGKTYQYRVSAFNGEGRSKPSTPITVDVPIAPPMGVWAEALNGHDMTVHWMPSQTTNVTGYRVFMSTSPGDIGSEVLNTDDKNRSSWTTEGPLEPNTTYYFHVKAKRGGSDSTASTVGSVMIPDVPTRPSTLTATPTSQYRVDLSWAASDNADGYIIYRHTTREGWVEIAQTDASTLTYEDISQINDPNPTGTPLQPGLNFYYRVVAFNAIGESGYSPNGHALMPFTDPASPTDLTITSPSADQLILTWDDNADDEVRFEVERSRYTPSGWDSKTFTLIGTVNPTTSGTATFTDNNLDAATTYFYRVRAVRLTGSGASEREFATEFSNYAYGITQFGPGPAPTFTAPMGFPGGPPTATETPLLAWRIRINGGNSYDFTGDPIAGRVTFTSEWIMARSPQEAMIKAVIPSATSINRTRPGEDTIENIPWLDPRFFRLDTLNFIGGTGVRTTPLPTQPASAPLLAANGPISAMLLGDDEECPEDPDDVVESQARDEVEGEYRAYVAADSGKWGDKEIHPCIEVTWECGDPGSTPTTRSFMDMDVDTFNDGGAGTRKEDMQETNGPGQYVEVSDGDHDGDTIPDFADGFNRFQSEGDDGPRNQDGVTTFDERDDTDNGVSNRFIPVYLALPPSAKRPEVPEEGHQRESDSLRVTFNYGMSDPNGVEREGEGTKEDPYVYSLPSGNLRLWKTSGQHRKLEPGEPGYIQPGQPGYPARGGSGLLRDPKLIAQGGDLIGSGSDFEAFEIFGYGRTAVVYVEAVNGNVSPETISVTVGSLSDSVVISPRAGVVDIDIDSDNTSDAQPERTDVEDQHEMDYDRPGKIVVVNNVDKDADGIVDFGDWETETGKFVPVQVELPAGLDMSKLALQINYTGASDPNEGEDHDGEGYEPAAGSLRLWTKDQSETRNPLSVLDGGDWLSPLRVIPATLDVPEHTEQAIFQGSDLSLLNFSGNIATFYVEAVRAGTGTISISVDPDGVDLDLTDPPCVGDEKPAPFLFHDSVKITAVSGFAPDTYTDTVRSADGALLFAETDIASNAGVPFGVTRFFTSAPEMLLAFPAGTGLSQWPKMIQGTSTVIVTLGTEAIFFDAVAEGYKARYGSHDKLTKQGGGYILGRADGSRIEFNGFAESVAPEQRGAFKIYTSPGGKKATASAPDSDGRITEVITDSGTTLAYTYHPNAEEEKNKARIKDVTLSNGEGVIQKASYTYYTKSDGEVEGTEFRGNDGDVQTVTIYDHNDTVVEKKHYRYGKNAGEGIRPLSYIIDGPAWARMTEDGHEPETADPTTIAKYAAVAMTYSGAGVSTIDTQGSGNSTKDDLDAKGRYTYSAGWHNPEDAYGANAWMFKTSKTAPSGLAQTAYMNYAGQEMLTSDVVGDLTYLTYSRYDDHNRAILTAEPSAVLEEDAELLAAAEISEDEGLVTHYTYFDAEDDNAGYLEEVSVSRGENGPRQKQHTYTYESKTAGTGGADVKFVSTDTIYRDGNSDPIETTYTYVFGTDAQPSKVTVTSKVITTSENGTGAAQVTSTEFDAYGRVTIVTDGDGKKTATTYDDSTGAVTSIVRDQGGTDESTITISEWDRQGRPLEMSDGNGNVTTYVYTDSVDGRKTTITPPANDTGITASPVTETSENWKKGFTEVVTKSGNDIQSLEREYLDYGGRAVESLRYFNLTDVSYDPEERFGTKNTHYYVTELRYDAGGRQHSTTNAVGTVYESEFNAYDQLKTEKVGGTLVRSYEYDDGEAGDGNLTKITTHTETDRAQLDRITTLHYDWRNRQVGIDNGSQIFFSELNNLGQAKTLTVYDALPSGSVLSESGGNWTAPADGYRRAKTTTLYDVLGRPYRSTQHWVNPADGVISGELETNTFYNGRDMARKIVEPGGRTIETTYDGVGRPSIIAVAANSTVVSTQTMVYDDNDNLLTDTTADVLPSGTRDTHVAYWYDANDRLSASADYGTNSSVGHPSQPPSRSDTELLTEYKYDLGGHVEFTIDPNNVSTRTQRDLLGRTTSETGAYVSGGGFDADTNRRSFYEYNGLDQQTLVRRVLPGGAQRDTVMEYDAMDRLGIVKHAGHAGSATPQAFQDSYTYNNVGEMIGQADHRGPTREYTRDALGRVTMESLSYGNINQIESEVKSRKFEYDALGRLNIATSYAGGNGGGAIVNQVKRDYDGFGNVITEYQQPGAAVSGSTLAVHYEYLYTGGAPRLSRMVYPTTDAQFSAGQGRSVWHGYEGNDAILGRATWIADAQSGGNQILERYQYAGLATVATRERTMYDTPSQALSQSYVNGGWDPVGRVKTLTWNLTGTTPQTALDMRYWYDRNSNVLTQQNVVNTGFTEIYHANGSGDSNAYDKLNQIKSFNRGTISNSTSSGRPNMVSPVASTQGWGSTAEGKSQRNGLDNEIKQRPIFQGAYTDGDMMDRVEEWNGNNGDPEPTKALANRFDGWGNLTKLQEFDINWVGINSATKTNERIFTYDALDRRIGETFAGAGNVMFVDLAGNVIEERKFGQNTTQNVWSPATGEMVLRDRDNDNNPATGASIAPPGIDERLWVLYDGQGNVSAITDAGGVVIERYFYTPEGHLLITDTAGVARTASLYEWRYTFGGGRQDGNGIYRIGDIEWDYLTGGPLEHDAQQYWDARLAYTPPALSSFDQGVLGTLKYAQIGLDLIGVVDPTGIADGINAGLYALQGDWTNAGISLAGAVVPYAGDLAKLAKLGGVVKKATSVVDAGKGLVARGVHSVRPLAALANAGTRAGKHAIGSKVMSIGVNAGVGYSTGFAAAAGASYYTTGEVDWSAANRAGLMSGAQAAIGGAVNPYICFVAGTKVVVGIEDEDGNDLLADGAERTAVAEADTATATVTATKRHYITMPIEDLVAAGGGEMGDGGGQSVLARDEHDPNGDLKRQRITRTYQRTAHVLQVLTLRDADGNEQTLRVTEEHPFYNDGWTPAKALQAGDVVRGEAGDLDVVANSRELHPDGVTVYNLEVEQGHTYFVRAEHAGSDADAVWVHNATYSQGGPYSLVKDRRGQIHHAPANSASPLSTSRGPSWRMSRRDHMQTASWGSSNDAKAYRKIQRQLIREGKFFDAMKMDIDDTRALFGDKYDKGIQEALNYATKNITNYGKMRIRPLP